jgi:hypothetical protein
LVPLSTDPLTCIRTFLFLQYDIPYRSRPDLFPRHNPSPFRSADRQHFEERARDGQSRSHSVRRLLQADAPQDVASVYTDPATTYSAQPEMIESAKIASKMQQPYVEMYQQYIPAQPSSAYKRPPIHRTRMGRHERIRPDYPEHPRHAKKHRWQDETLPIEERSESDSQSR